jgi:non-canonical purine NTP pyrophosphatase (RdgB/HAM1 family)
MAQITVVTGNPDKLKEIQLIAGNNIKLVSKPIDLIEIQSMDLKEIVENKVKAAYEAVGGPVIVEDVSAGLDGLEGLPGTFYKYFRQRLSETVLLKLVPVAGSNKVTIQCLAAYYDGHKIIYGLGVVKGTVVEPRGKNGFGFDPVIVPNGSKSTLGEMLPDQKIEYDHRGQAFRKLFAKL